MIKPLQTMETLKKYLSRTCGIVAALYAFADHYPDAWVYATGSTSVRTRLYRMGINKYFDIVATDFDIMGEHQSEWEWYELGKDYQAFAVRRKNSKFEL